MRKPTHADTDGKGAQTETVKHAEIVKHRQINIEKHSNQEKRTHLAKPTINQQRADTYIHRYKKM